MDDTDTYPPGGPSNEEVPGLLHSDTFVVAPSPVPTAAPRHANDSADTLVVAPSTVPAAAPTRFHHSTDRRADAPSPVPTASATGVHLSGSEEDAHNSMVSEEVGDIVQDKRVTWNLPAGEGSIASVSEEDTEPYTMTRLPNLDSMALRRSSRTAKPSAVVLEHRRQHKEAAYHKINPKRKLYGLFTMSTLCTLSVILSSVSALPTCTVHKAAYHTEKPRKKCLIYIIAP